MTTEYVGILSIILAGVFLASASLKVIPNAMQPLEQAMVSQAHEDGDEAKAEQVAAANGPSSRRSIKWAIAAAMALVTLLVVTNVCWRIRKQSLAMAQCEEEDEFGQKLPPEEQGIKTGSHVDKRLAMLRAISKVDGLSQGSLNVNHFMTRNVISVAPDATRDELEKLVWKHHIRHVLVVKDSSLLGIISDRDMLSRDGHLAEQLMTADPTTITPATRACTAVSLMLERRVSCLPVVDGNSVVGVVTTADVMMALQCVLRLVDSLSDRIHQERLAVTG